MNDTISYIRQHGTLIGTVLVALGLIALASELAKDWFAYPDGFVQLAIAVVLLVAYAFSRQYLFLVFGAILVGTGIGTGLQDYGYDEKGGLVAIFSGAGFLAVYLVDVLTGTTRRWWPIVPGTILVWIGGVALAQGTAAELWVERLWPAVLVVAGIVVVVASRRAHVPTVTANKPATP